MIPKCGPQLPTNMIKNQLMKKNHMMKLHMLMLQLMKTHQLMKLQLMKAHQLIAALLLVVGAVGVFVVGELLAQGSVGEPHEKVALVACFVVMVLGMLWCLVARIAVWWHYERTEVQQGS